MPDGYISDKVLKLNPPHLDGPHQATHHEWRPQVRSRNVQIVQWCFAVEHQEKLLLLSREHGQLRKRCLLAVNSLAIDAMLGRVVSGKWGTSAGATGAGYAPTAAMRDLYPLV